LNKYEDDDDDEDDDDASTGALQLSDSSDFDKLRVTVVIGQWSLLISSLGRSRF